MNALLAPVRRTGGQRSLFGPPRGEGGALASMLREPVREGVTLEERLTAAFDDVLAEGTAECPLCGDRLARVGDEGRCGGCGSALS